MDIGRAINAWLTGFTVTAPAWGTVNVSAYAAMPPPIDQGTKNECTVEATLAVLAARSKAQGGSVTLPSAEATYQAMVGDADKALGVRDVAAYLAEHWVPSVRCAALFEGVTGDAVIASLRGALARHEGPLVVGVALTHAWFGARGKSELVVPPHDLFMFNHAVALYEAVDLPAKEAGGYVEVLNSWGPGWGNPARPGTIKVRYQDAANMIFAAYKVTL